jgi:hypothetical protein
LQLFIKGYIESWVKLVNVLVSKWLTKSKTQNTTNNTSKSKTQKSASMTPGISANSVGVVTAEKILIETPLTLACGVVLPSHECRQE